jgi:NADH-quinone oxidoreductase subunit G
MTKLLVDDIEVDVPADYTLLQACEAAGVEIPRFCFHDRLSIAGNCRMCLVEVKGGPPKPQASCAVGVKDLRPGPNGELPRVLTKSPMVKKAREGVMEFLLINHPLDCPICDQGGECDLQDQAMAYGVDSSRFAENKRAVEDKYIGVMVRTSMNRCIHCTRCVRFTAEVAGTGDMGAIGRGEDMEITTYLESAMQSELQGNVADLCPVGALLPKPYAFKARPWELTKTPSIDVMDALGSNIRVDTRGREVMRILPRVNDAVNEEWISDKARQIVDGLKSRRLDRPMIRKAGKLQPASWSEAFAAIAARVKETKPERLGAIAGDLCAVEEMFALKLLIEALGAPNLDCRQAGEALDPKLGRASYTFAATIEGIDHADAILIVGSNPRRAAPVLNARIRKRWLKGNLLLGLVGEAVDLTFSYDHLGTAPATLTALPAAFTEAWTKAQAPLVIVGEGALTRSDGGAVLAAASRLGPVSIIHTAAARVGGLDLGFVPGAGGLDVAGMIKPGALDVLFNLGADEVSVAPGAFMVYIGTHGDRGAARADVILPGATYTEKSGLYVNLEGRVQLADRANFPPGEAREDWAILRALSERLGRTLPFDSLAQLRRALTAAVPHFARLDAIAEAPLADFASLAGALGEAPFASPIRSYYLTNPIARASKVMAEAQALADEPLRQAAE